MEKKCEHIFKELCVKCNLIVHSNPCKDCDLDKVCFKHGTYPDSIRPPKKNKCEKCNGYGFWAISYLQAGKTIECGGCFSDKYPDCKKIEKDYGVKCECVCHESTAGERCVDCKNGSSWKCRQPHICAAQIVKSPTVPAEWEKTDAGLSTIRLQIENCLDGFINPDKLMDTISQAISEAEKRGYKLGLEEEEGFNLAMKHIKTEQQEKFKKGYEEGRKKGAKQALESLLGKVGGMKAVWADKRTERGIRNAALKEVENLIQEKLK